MTTTSRTRRSRFRIWHAVVLVVGAAVCTLIALAIYVSPWNTQVRIDGTVVDATTKKPKPNSRVILTIVRKGFPYDGMVAKYGMVADNNGQFSLDRQSPERFHEICIEASTPSNGYGYVDVSGGVVDVEIKVSPLPQVLKDMPRMQYSHFGGGAPYTGIDGVEFIGDDWSIEGQ